MPEDGRTAYRWPFAGRIQNVHGLFNKVIEREERQRSIQNGWRRLAWNLDQSFSYGGSRKAAADDGDLGAVSHMKRKHI